MPEATPADYELAREALGSITTADTIGSPAGFVDEGDGVVTVYFETTMRGYTGWRWTVSIAHVEGLEPSVLETELTPGEGALLSPDWVPWADRMAEYRAAQAAVGADSAADSDDDDDDDDDDDEYGIDDLDDDDDVDEDFRERDDVDGVNIDELAPDVGVGEAGEAEGDADEAGPEPEVGARRPRARNKKQGGEGD